jgi:predicted small integral membrane protein
MSYRCIKVALIHSIRSLIGKDYVLIATNKNQRLSAGMSTDRSRSSGWMGIQSHNEWWGWAKSLQVALW